MRTIVISAYPCCGKSFLYENWKDQCTILDSDSSNFSWATRKRTEAELQLIRKQWDDEGHLLSGEGYINQIKDEYIKVRNPEFPNNYIKHIKDNLGKADIILVSSHLSVRQAMQDAGIKFVTVYPSRECMHEWIGRMVSREDPKSFIDFQMRNWDLFHSTIFDEPYGEDIIWLRHNQYLFDVIYDIIGSFYYKYKMKD